MGDDVETGASAAPTPDAGTSSPTPSESSPAPKPSLFAALMADEEDSSEDSAQEASTDGEGTEPTEGADPAAPDAKTETPEEAPSDEDLPKDLKAVFKKFPELRAAHFFKRDLDPLGISVEEAQAYRENIQSLEDLNYTVNRAQQLEALEGLFTHPADTAPEHFLEALGQVSSENRDRLVRHVATHLQAVAPEAFYELGGQAIEKALSRLDGVAKGDPFRSEAMQAVREMIAELTNDPNAGHQQAAPKPLPNPDADELSQRRAQEERAHSEWWQGIHQRADAAADQAVRAVVADTAKRRDPDGLLSSPETLEQIVNEIHRTISSVPAVNVLFRRALMDVSIPPDQRIAKAAALVQARAKNVSDLIFKKKTDGMAERIRKVSQTKLGKAARTVSIREATGQNRPAVSAAPPLPRGARPTSLQIFRATMKG